MAKKVEKWQANDGSLFDGKADATRHDKTRKLAESLLKEIESLSIYGSVDTSTLLVELTQGKLGEIVANIKAHQNTK